MFLQQFKKPSLVSSEVVGQDKNGNVLPSKASKLVGVIYDDKKNMLFTID